MITPFALWWVGMVHDYTLWRDDAALVRELLPGVRAVIDGFGRFLNAEGIIQAPAGWNFMDWAPEWRAGVPPEGQKFQPHVTLARSKGELVPKLGEFLVHHNLFRSPPFEVTHFTLFSSYLNHNGAIYMPERSYELSRELKRA